jgi:hypothetical protein
VEGDNEYMSHLYSNKNVIQIFEGNKSGEMLITKGQEQLYLELGMVRLCCIHRKK